jgi:hypothetical protein
MYRVEVRHWRTAYVVTLPREVWRIHLGHP